MTSINTGPNPYAQLGSAYARAAATQPSLANTLNDAETGNSPDNSATNLTLSAAARARLANGAASKDFTTVTAEARAALDALYAAAKVEGPIGTDGKTTVDLSSFDRRSLFAVATNNGGKFSPDEQKAATTELGNRFNNVLAPAAATSKLMGDFSSLYKAALDYLDGASDEEKATATWSAQRAAVAKGVQATLQNPAAMPDIANDPVGAYLSQNAAGDSTATQNISTVARKSAPCSTRRPRLPLPPARSSCSIRAARPVSRRTSLRSTTVRWRRSRSTRMACSRIWRAMPPSSCWLRAAAPAFLPHSIRARPAAIPPSSASESSTPTRR